MNSPSKGIFSPLHIQLVLIFCFALLGGKALAQGAQAQSIQFLPIADRAVNSAPFQVVALSSAYLPVTLQISGPATLNGRLITLTGVGEVTVTASQAGNTVYAPATAQIAFQSLMVTPKLALIPVTIPYGTPANGSLFPAAGRAAPLIDTAQDAATVSSQLDNSVLNPGSTLNYPATDALYRYEGAIVGPSTAVNDGEGYVLTPTPPNGFNFIISFTCDCQQFEFEIQARGATYRLWVDGAYTSVDEIEDTPAYPRRLFVLVTFPDKRVRDIKITDGGDAPFYGINTIAGDSISAPQDPIGPKVMIFGDSWTGPTILQPAAGPAQPGINGSGYPQTLGEFFNWDYQDDGVGGSGFTSVGLDRAGRTFVQRVQQDLCPNTYQSVFILGGNNDSVPEATEEAAVSQTISEIQTCEPDSPIYLYGPQYDAQPQIEAAMAAAAAAAQAFGPLSYLDISEANWIYGSTTDPSTGNAYLYINGHPTPLGHDFLAEMFAADLVHKFPNLMPQPYALLAPAPLSGATFINQLPAVPSVGSYPVTLTFQPTDTAHFNQVTASTTLTVTQASTTTSETVARASGVATLTATVSPQISGVPSGIVAFFDQGSGQTLATATLTDGVATAQLVLKQLSPGSHSVNAAYSGDDNFLPSTAQTPVTFSATSPDFSFTLGQSQLTLAPGSAGSLPLTVFSAGGLTGPLSVQCLGLPQNASCSLNGAPSLTGPSVAATLTLRAYTPTASLAPAEGKPWWPVGGAGAVCCLLGGLPLWRRRRAFSRYAAMLALFALLAGGAGLLTGCGSFLAIDDAMPGTYAVQVEITVNAGTSAAVVHSEPITLNLP
jgi:lysophospholipase L1-like esterase